MKICSMKSNSFFKNYFISFYIITKRGILTNLLNLSCNLRKFVICNYFNSWIILNYVPSTLALVCMSLQTPRHYNFPVDWSFPFISDGRSNRVLQHNSPRINHAVNKIILCRCSEVGTPGCHSSETDSI